MGYKIARNFGGYVIPLLCHQSYPEATFMSTRRICKPVRTFRLNNKFLLILSIILTTFSNQVISQTVATTSSNISTPFCNLTCINSRLSPCLPRSGVVDTTLGVSEQYVCHKHKDCYGGSSTQAVPVQQKPVYLIIGQTVAFRLDQTIANSPNLYWQLYNISGEQFRTCNNIVDEKQLLSNITQISYAYFNSTLYGSGTYYFAGVGNNLLTCNLGLRIQVAVKSQNCNEIGYSGQTCNGKGKCIAAQNDISAACQCCKGYNGSYCSEYDGCTSSPCLNSGNCTDVLAGHANNYSCSCTPFFTGKRCETKIDYCRSTPCLNNGTCLNNILMGNYSCNCQLGFTGRNCELDINECSSHNCSNNSTCVDKINGFECRCQGNWTGKYCHEDVNECNVIQCKNGGACVNTPGSFFCNCVVNTTGRLCEVDLYDNCLSNPCLNRGSCIDLVGGFSCKCPQGFNGSICGIDLDECASNPCSVQGSSRCINGRGNFSCVCLSEYTGRKCDQFLNRCASQPCLNGGLCVNLYGSYSCVCPAGYRGKKCQDVLNKCSYKPCKNNGTCVRTGNFLSNYTCSCKPGWTGRNCTKDVDECLSNPCLNSGTCLNLFNAYSCNCDVGWNGTNCEQNVNACDQHPCKNGATCTDLMTKLDYTCTCTPGFTGKNCSVNINDCVRLNANCNYGKCIDQTGSYYCNCSDGWYGKYCDTNRNICAQRICQNSAICENVNTTSGYACTCQSGWTGTNCAVNINDCVSSPCQNGGTCNDYLNFYNCSCLQGYAGKHCQSDINECLSQPCQNNATCVEGIGKFTCICLKGFGGTRCENNINECGSNPCFNNATCKDGINQYTCQCLGGFTGIHCEIPKCLTNPCLNGATCIQQTDGFTCQCAPGYTGQLCDSQINECLSNPCRNNGSCFDLVNGYRCNCNTGYTGSNCQTHLCDTNVCKNGASCVRSITGYSCTCLSGYTGSTCNENINECLSNPCNSTGSLNCTDLTAAYKCFCRGGYTGQTCNTHVCDSLKPCKNNASCIQLPDRYHCQCLSGYTGIDCGININDCLPNPCNNGTCIDGINGYKCVCPAMYTGVTCETNLNKCASNPCFNNGTCTNNQTSQSFTCNCQGGYTGKQCQLHLCDATKPCKNNATCLKLPSGYSCQCLGGYTGLKCEQDINECSSSPCLNGGACQNRINSFKCSCPRNYTGSRCETFLDYCSPNPCNLGSCSNDYITHTFNCSCPPAYSGRRCTIHICDIKNPCKNGATCIRNTRKATCQCLPGYTGQNCSTNVLECSSSPCRNNGTCIDAVNSFTCNCLPKFTGSRCETPVNYCSSSPCRNSGTCVNDFPSKTYKCICQSYATGKNCETYLGPCYMNPCKNNGTCSETPGYSYRCTCPFGYNGTQCEDITCPCQNNGRCVNNAGKVDCLCQNGYGGTLCEAPYGDCRNNASLKCLSDSYCKQTVYGYTCQCPGHLSGSRTCRLISTCNPSPCLNNGGCTAPSISSLKCACPAGYTGQFCQFDVNECLPNPCQNRGKCREFGVNGFKCYCPAGYYGNLCLNKTASSSVTSASHFSSRLMTSSSIRLISPSETIYSTGYSSISARFTMLQSTLNTPLTSSYPLTSNKVTMFSAKVTSVADKSSFATPVQTSSPKIASQTSINVQASSAFTRTRAISYMESSSHSQNSIHPSNFVTSLFHGSLATATIDIATSTSSEKPTPRSSRFSDALSFSTPRTALDLNSFSTASSAKGTLESTHSLFQGTKSTARSLYYTSKQNIASSSDVLMSESVFSSSKSSISTSTAYSTSLIDSKSEYAGSTSFASSNRGQSSWRSQETNIKSTLSASSTNSKLALQSSTFNTPGTSSLQSYATPVLTTIQSYLPTVPHSSIAGSIRNISSVVLTKRSLPYVPSSFALTSKSFFSLDGSSLLPTSAYTLPSSASLSIMSSFTRPVMTSYQASSRVAISTSREVISDTKTSAYTPLLATSSLTTPEKVATTLRTSASTISLPAPSSAAQVSSRFLNKSIITSASVQTNVAKISTDRSIAITREIVATTLRTSASTTSSSASSSAGQISSRFVNRTIITSASLHANVTQISTDQSILGSYSKSVLPTIETPSSSSMRPNVSVHVSSLKSERFMSTQSYFSTSGYFLSTVEVASSQTSRSGEFSTVSLSSGYSLSTMRFSTSLPLSTKSNVPTSSVSRDPCVPNPCLQSGTCKLTSSTSFNCTCPIGFGGLICDNLQCQCQNNGRCVRMSSAQSYRCICKVGFNGTLCEQPISDCRTNNCSGNGVCRERLQGFVCSCNAGYHGDLCESFSNNCVPNPCMNNGVCVTRSNATGGGFTCACRPGLQGQFCQFDYNECATSPCLNGGTCREDAVNSYKCYCPTWSNGTNCQILQTSRLASSFVKSSLYYSESSTRAYFSSTHRPKSTVTSSRSDQTQFTTPSLVRSLTPSSSRFISTFNATEATTSTRPLSSIALQTSQMSRHSVSITSGTSIPSVVQYTKLCTAVSCSQSSLLIAHPSSNPYMQTAFSAAPTSSLVVDSSVHSADFGRSSQQNSYLLSTSTFHSTGMQFSSEVTRFSSSFRVSAISVSESSVSRKSSFSQKSSYFRQSSPSPQSSVVFGNASNSQVQTSLASIIDNSKYTTSVLSSYPSSVQASITAARTRSTFVVQTSQVAYDSSRYSSVSSAYSAISVSSQTIVSTKHVLSQSSYATSMRTSVLQTLSSENIQVTTSPALSSAAASTSRQSSVVPTLIPTTSPLKNLTCADNVCNGYPCFNESINGMKFRCSCPYPTFGPRCIQGITIHFPLFNGYSYARYASIPFLNVINTIVMTFRTTKAEGLLLYAGHKTFRDFVMLRITGGFLEFRFDAGADVIFIRSLERVNTGSLVTLIAQHDSRSGMGTLTINGSAPISKSTSSSFKSIQLSTSWYLGGAPITFLAVNTSKAVPTFDSLAGCIKDLQVNNKPYRILNAAMWHSIGECDVAACQRAPCRNNATCTQNKENSQQYTCQCGTGYLGRDCTERQAHCQGDPCNGGTCVWTPTGHICLCQYGRHGPSCLNPINITAPTFNQVYNYSSYIEYPWRLTMKNAAERFEIRMQFKLNSLDSRSLRNGILAYAAQSTIGTTGDDFFALGIINNHTYLIYNLGGGLASIRSSTPIDSTRTWHLIVAGRTGSSGYMYTDNQPVVRATSPGVLIGLDAYTPLYIGGVPDFSKLPSIVRAYFYSGFIGVLYDVSFRTTGSGFKALLTNSTGSSLPGVQSVAVERGLNIGDSQVNDCQPNPCKNNGTCSQTGGQFQCSCLSGWTGILCQDKIIPCVDYNPCSAGSVCRSDTTGVVCDCPLGKTSTFCDKVVKIIQPYFKANSYMGFTKPTIKYITKVFLRFKAAKLDGLLFYVSEKVDSSNGDFFAISLWQGYVYVRFNLGLGMTTMRTRKKIITNQWHTLYVERRYKEAIMRLDSNPLIGCRSSGAYTQLNVGSILYLGGLPWLSALNPTAVKDVASQKDFEGCVSQFTVNDVSKVLNSTKAVVGRNIDDCSSSCILNQCKNGAICSTQATNKQYPYSCTCALGWQGLLCDQAVSAYSKAKFSGDGYIFYQDSITTPLLNNHIEFVFNTTSDGLLLWFGQLRTSKIDYLALGVKNSKLSLSFNTGSGVTAVSINQNITDGRSHKVTVRRDGLTRTLLLIVNGFPPLLRPIVSADQALDNNGHFYIGGLDGSVNTLTKGQYSSGLVGCIWDVNVKLNGAILSLNKNAANKGLNVRPCG